MRKVVIIFGQNQEIPTIVYSIYVQCVTSAKVCVSVKVNPGNATQQLHNF